MNHILSVGIAKSVSDQTERTHRVSRIAASQYADVRFTDKLLAEIRTLGIIMKLEDANYVRMHQATADTPLALQEILLSRVARRLRVEKFERDGGFSGAICRQPYV